jgi:hypothetical protein
MAMVKILLATTAVSGFALWHGAGTDVRKDLIGTSSAASPRYMGTFMQGCELFLSLDPQGYMYPVPVATCAALREKAKTMDSKEAFGNCQQSFNTAVKVTYGFPPQMELPDELGNKVFLACWWILEGKY